MMPVIPSVQMRAFPCGLVRVRGRISKLPNMREQGRATTGNPSQWVRIGKQTFRVQAKVCRVDKQVTRAKAKAKARVKVKVKVDKWSRVDFTSSAKNRIRGDGK